LYSVKCIWPFMPGWTSLIRRLGRWLATEFVLARHYIHDLTPAGSPRRPKDPISTTGPNRASGAGAVEHVLGPWIRARFGYLLWILAQILGDRSPSVLALMICNSHFPIAGGRVRRGCDVAQLSPQSPACVRFRHARALRHPFSSRKYWTSFAAHQRDAIFEPPACCPRRRICSCMLVLCSARHRLIERGAADIELLTSVSRIRLLLRLSSASRSP